MIPLLLTTILALRPAVTAPDVPARFIASHAITRAVELEDGAPFRGEHRHAKAQAALVAIGIAESGLDGRVLSCSRKGALGELSGWQLMPGRSLAGHTEREVCDDPTLAARLALRVLGRTRASVGAALAAYVGGSAAHRRRVEATRCRTYERAARLLGVPAQAARCGGVL